MVWENSVQAIVILGPVIECEQVVSVCFCDSLLKLKIHKYWPDTVELFGRVYVSTVGEEMLHKDEILVRHLELALENV